MLRHILFIAAGLLLSGFATAQKEKEKIMPPDMPRSEEDNKVYYMDVITEETGRTELYNRFNIWYRKFYKNPTGVLESADSAAGKMLLKPQFSVFKEKDKMKVQSGIVRYSFVMGFKDGKYRYEIRDVNLKSSSYIPIEKLFNEDDPNFEDSYNTLLESHRYFTALIEDLEVGMREPSNKVKQDEW